ncbi:hypothetical protein Tco_1386788 [Tanacetum coccineum]
MNNSKRGYIPMQERLDLNKRQGASTPEEVNALKNVPYASAVGSIMYAVKMPQDLKLRSAVKNINKVRWKNLEAELDLIAIAILELTETAHKQSTTENVPDTEAIYSLLRSAMKLFGLGSLFQALSIALGEIRFLKLHTHDNLADLFTKALPKGKLTQHARSTGLRLASSFM